MCFDIHNCMAGGVTIFPTIVQYFQKGFLQLRYYSCKMSKLLDRIEDVSIDPSGTFKYILITVTDNTSKESKQIVRGHVSASYHADIFEATEAEMKKISSVLQLKCMGGGRINHEPEQKKLYIYGYSQGYGKANHQITVVLAKKKYPDYNITWSDEGY